MARTSWQPTLVLPVTEGRDHIRGRMGAPVTLVEYGDLECPHCGAAFPVVETIRERLGDTLCFVYRHFPISAIHPHAEPAAEAAEAAGAQGKFWEMHRSIFERQDQLAPEDLVSRAVALGLDVPRFEADLLSHTHHDRVREDFLSGVRSGVNGTPTFFINGVRHDGGYSIEELLPAVAQAAAVKQR